MLYLMRWHPRRHRKPCCPGALSTVLNEQQREQGLVKWLGTIRAQQP
jgi:hypothetical protein